MDTDAITNLIVSRFDAVEGRLKNIEDRLSDKTEKNGTQNTLIQQNCDSIGILQRRGEWSNRKAAVWMVAAAFVGALVGNIDKIKALF